MDGPGRTGDTVKVAGPAKVWTVVISGGSGEEDRKRADELWAKAPQARKTNNSTTAADRATTAVLLRISACVQPSRPLISEVKRCGSNKRPSAGAAGPRGNAQVASSLQHVGGAVKTYAIGRGSKCVRRRARGLSPEGHVYETISRTISGRGSPNSDRQDGHR